MSNQQQLQLDAILRQGQFDDGGDVQTLRTAFAALMAQVPVAPDVQQNPVELGGVAGIGSAAFSVPFWVISFEEWAPRPSRSSTD